MFAMDSSISVDDVSFRRGLNFVKNVSEKFDHVIGRSLSKGVIQFSLKAVLAIPLNKYTRKDFSYLLNRMQRMKSGFTDYEEALNLCRQQFQKQNNGIPKNLIVLITDGLPNNVRKAIHNVSQLKRSLDVDTIFVGIGQIHQKTVDQLVPITNQFYAKNHEDLNNLVNTVTMRICKLSGGISAICSIMLLVFIIVVIIFIPLVIFLGFTISKMSRRRSRRLKEFKAKQRRRSVEPKAKQGATLTNAGKGLQSDDVSHLSDLSHIKKLNEGNPKILTPSQALDSISMESGRGLKKSSKQRKQTSVK